MKTNMSVNSRLILLGLALCAGALPVQAQISFRAAASAATTGATLIIATPAATIASDVMIASIGFSPSTATLAPPAGWTLVRRIDNPNATSSSLAIYLKVAGAAEPGRYAWDVAGASFTVGGIQAFFNVDTANPIDVEDGQTTPSALTHSTPRVTTTMANTMLVTSHTFATSSSWTPPLGMTEGFDIAATPARPGGGQSIEGNYVLQATAGAIGVKTATASGVAGDEDVGNTHNLALRPGSAGVAQMFFIHSDHLNTPRVITNSTGQAVWRLDQGEPFGNSLPDENPSGLGNFTCNLRLPGQYFDKESNTHYNMARDYDPAIGRYIQSDPIGLAGGINTYAYVDSNPLSRADPTGQIWPAIGGMVWIGQCSLVAYKLASDAYPNPADDKKKHCYASCILNKCTLLSFLPSLAVGWGYEESQRLVGGNYDPLDIEANLYGILASYRGPCRQECDACPIR